MKESKGWEDRLDRQFDRIMSIGHKVVGKTVTYNCQTDCKDDVKDFIRSELKRQRDRLINRIEKEKKICDEYHCKIFDKILTELEEHEL